MSSKRVGRASAVVLLLIVLSVCAAGGMQLGEEKVQKDYSTAASRDGSATAAAADHPSMVKTNDYGHYDPAPAFSKPRFKLIPN